MRKNLKLRRRKLQQIFKSSISEYKDEIKAILIRFFKIEETSTVFGKNNFYVILIIPARLLNSYLIYIDYFIFLS